MITLHIGRLLEDAGFGTLLVNGDETDPSIFVEQITLDATDSSRNGIWIESRGFPLSRGSRVTSAFDIYARYPAPFIGAEKLKAVRKYLKSAYRTVCELPTIPDVSESVYNNVTIQPTGIEENIGRDAEGRIVWVLSGKISYNEN